jgi:hypothetical protein
MGILNHQAKMLKKLFQLDLFESEPNQQAFSQFIDNDLQRIIPKQIPINALGLKEIIHQLRINIHRLGLVTTLLLIDNLQQINQSGLLLTLNKHPSLKRYLIQLIEHLQTGRYIGVYLQRLVEQMNNSLQINTIKKGLFTNQINTLLQKTKLTSNNEKFISVLINLADHGQLNTYLNTTSQPMSTYSDIQTDIDTNNLQSLLLLLQEQSSLPSQYVNDFIQYLRHFAQLGILYEPKLFHILSILHKSKDQNKITIETFKLILNQMKTINYLYTYSHLNLIEFDQFLDELILNSKRKILVKRNDFIFYP